MEFFGRIRLASTLFMKLKKLPGTGVGSARLGVGKGVNLRRRSGPFFSLFAFGSGESSSEGASGLHNARTRRLTAFGTRRKGCRPCGVQLPLRV